MSLLDSTPASKTAFGAGLTTCAAAGQAATSDPTASEHWPYSGTAVEGGDQATLGKLIGLDPRTGAPSSSGPHPAGCHHADRICLDGGPARGDMGPPDCGRPECGGDFVAPSAAAAKAAEATPPSLSTSDPTTNNLVTFNASATDATAYNNYLMMESYLVVPTNGLPADKAQALAQFIRFAVGGKGQADITALGAAPATPQMVTADLAVAQELNAEAASASSSRHDHHHDHRSTSSSTTLAASTSGTGASSTGASPTSTGTTGSTTGGGLARDGR